MYLIMSYFDPMWWTRSIHGFLVALDVEIDELRHWFILQQKSFISYIYELIYNTRCQTFVLTHAWGTTEEDTEYYKKIDPICLLCQC
jgi:cellulose synthase/poly-beta-1,6-N-acetylglucosamine synthase-like glycosyltransferase